VGSSTFRLEVYDHGALVGTVEGHTGTVATVTGGSPDPIGCGKGLAIIGPDSTACFAPRWPDPVTFDIPGVGPIVGDEIRVLAEEPAGSFGGLQTFEIRVSGYPELDIVDEMIGEPGACDCATWSEVASGPSARRFPAMEYDSDREVMLLFGGVDADGNRLDDTWEFDGSSWTELSPSNPPSPRSASGIAYDVARERMVLYGGVDDTGRRGDTWEFVGGEWVLVSDGGPNSSQAGMAYDRSREVVVRYGGETGSGKTRRTWEYDGLGWTEVDSGTPGYRSNHDMAYDSSLGGCVAYGGITAGGGYLNDTWLWDGSSWTELASGPPARQRHTLVTDDGCGGVLLFGGLLESLENTDEVWRLVDGAWVAVSGSGPSAREQHAAAFHSGMESMFVFGGESADIAQGDGWRFGCEVVLDAEVPSVAPTLPIAVRAVPSPFRSGTWLRYALPHGTHVRLTVFDAEGRRVRVLADGVTPAGEHAAYWSGRDADGRMVPAGVYFYRLEAGASGREGKLVRLP